MIKIIYLVVKKGVVRKGEVGLVVLIWNKLPVQGVDSSSDGSSSKALF